MSTSTIDAAGNLHDRTGRFAGHRRSEADLGAVLTLPDISAHLGEPVNGGVRPATSHTRAGSLSYLMDFDHVVAVGPGGVVHSPARDMYAPECYDPDVDETELHDGWTLLSGYTQQQGYRGPWMHPSEQIAGRLAEDILSEPGFYVAIAPVGVEPPDHEFDGWGVAFKPFE